MHTSDPLSALVSEFEYWRIHKKKAGDTIPITLRQQAISLLSQYKVSQVSAALRISGSQFKIWQQQLSPNSELLANQNQEFIELAHDEFSQQQPISLELCFVSGEQLRLSCVNSQMVISIIEALKS